jgi:TonB family protein
MDVTDVLRDRMQEASGLEGTATTVSVLAHGLLIAMVLFAPSLFLKPVADVPKTVMTITLGGGAPGLATGGMTAAGGRPVQEVKPAEEAAKPEALRPPAAQTPEMTLPEKNAKPEKNPRAPIKEAPADARGRTPTRGAEVAPGTAAAPTTVRGGGFGLSTGPGGNTGLKLEVTDFCCPEYLETMQQRIRSNWEFRADTTADVVVKFTILRSGQITSIAVVQSSGNVLLDIRAQRAIFATRLPPLPPAFTNPSLSLEVVFQYKQ